MSNKIGRNDKCPCGSGKKLKKCCLVIEGINAIGDDSYFIRLIDDKNQYIHLEAEDDEKYTYRIKEGIKGACGWHKKDGENFIAMNEMGNIELVKMSEILGTDASLN
jgi:hypothetical protein